jgi:hypothetical protein
MTDYSFRLGDQTAEIPKSITTPSKIIILILKLPTSALYHHLELSKEKFFPISFFLE